MANASKKHMGVGASGKGAGVGAMTEAVPEEIPANMPLSNRDKQRHPEERGLDSKGVQTDQLKDHAANRLPEE